ncbi:MAG TPA: translation initiation factor IF-2 [Bryobacteraceae bacterium]|nr:translation initiation factor IF-2 [Bryobacteraceae bacterium]
MTKIRINELARQLEVPSHLIIEMLPELGVSEKKTHSSSIDESVEKVIRERLQGAAGAAARQESGGSVAVAEIETEEHPARPEPVAEHSPVPAKPAPLGGEPPANSSHTAPAQEATVSTVEEPLRSKPAPLRPPLAAGGAAPLHPPLRTGPIPARPVPAPRPGQILSGPRQPIPPAAPASPMPPASITIPAPPVARAAPAAPSSPATTESASPSMPAPGAMPMPGTPLRPQPRPNLAGQPAARPVVPPRPDMVARLQQTRPAPGQVQQPPRPGLPARSATPVPGQPIYRGPIRPGQPVMRGPGVGGGPPGPGGGGPPGAFRRPRTLHPTSPLRAEPATPIPTEQQRRHQGKPVSRDRHRDQEQEEGRLRMPSRRGEQAAAPPPIDREITISEGVTVKELSEKLGIKANLVIKKLVEKKIFATINQNLDVKMAEDLAREFGASTNKISYEEESTQEISEAEVTTDKVRRAPVVTIMGHVDHGKTSLLDSIRSAHVADREAGGITQHIGAYYVEKNGRKIVFIDTPGHEAFTRMRARGAKVTDIVILVVSADDGVMPQTIEAIDHAKAAGAPIIVAINKIDKPDAQPERVKQQLADRGLLAEDWGGDVVMVPVSAKAKTNLDLLLEMILLVADMLDLKANPDRPAVGNVLEANLDRGRGPVATVLVRNGTLRVGDYFICGSVFGKVRAMFDDRGGPLREAEPSMPVEVLGLDSLPEVGDMFQVVTDTAKAKQIVIYREAKARDVAMSKSGRMTLEQFHEQLKEGEVKELNIILKTDVSGTAEVLSDMMQKLSNDKVRIRVLRSAVGAINESDVLLASTSSAIVIGFNVRPERNATALAEQEKVDIRLHTIIYELTDELKRAMTGMLAPVFKEVYQGRAEVREVFRISKVGNVAGCMVIDGFIKRDSEVRVLRDNVVVFTGKMESLKRFKNDASEVKTGFECGVTVRNFADIKPRDVIEAFVTERVAVEAMA